MTKKHRCVRTPYNYEKKKKKKKAFYPMPSCFGVKLRIFSCSSELSGGAHFKSHRTCSTDFSDNGSTDGGLSSTEELEDEDGSPPPAKPPLPPKAKNQRQPTVVPNQGSDRAQAMISGVGSTSHERPPTLPPKRSQTQATSHLRSDVVTRL